MSGLKINEVEALVGITKKNIRFYEEKGLLCPVRNSENGYRDYGQAEVEELRRIKLLRKLGLPIEEIRRMQEGKQTVGDGMRRHLVTLERDRQNIDEAVRLCRLLQEREIPLGELDAEDVLAEMERLEQSGASFQFQKIRAFSDFALEIPHNPEKIKKNMTALIDSLSDDALKSLEIQMDQFEEDMAKYS